MSINISSDDSSDYNLPEVDIVGSLKESQHVSKSQSSVDTNADNDAMFDQMFPNEIPLKITPSYSGSAGCSQTSSGYSSSNTNKKRRTSTDDSEGRISNKKKSTAQRIAKKQKEAEERTARKHRTELSKIYKPAECMKYMYVEMHPDLSDAWYCSDLSRELNAVGTNLVPSSDIFDPALVMWSRRTPQQFANNNEVGPTTECCDRALLVLTAEELSSKVKDHTLTQHLSQVAAVIDCRLTLVVFGVKEYFKASNRRKNNRNDQLMTEIDLEMAITDLLVSSDCDAIVVNTPNELALLIVQTTKAIAETPFKKAKRAADEQAEFYMRGESKKCVPVDKEGRGLSRLWQQMLAVLPQSSLETSRALTVQFPSPLALYEALQSCDSVASVADIGVSRAAVPGARARRLGPEFAKKLRLLFTAADGSILVE